VTTALSRATRKDVVDWLVVEGVSWSGRLSDEAFLDRVVDLDSLPSTDPRFETARQDLWQHLVNNDDWESDWVFSYGPLALLTGDDEVFLKFLCEMLHPVVRPDTVEARTLARELNDLLRNDKAELFEASTIGDRPVWSARTGAEERRATATGQAPTRPTTSRADGQDRIWEPGMLRLFLSHVSTHKLLVATLKARLRTFGVSAFVAHEDIEPSLEWQGEIELALSSMHAMAALLTPDFHASNWTDHEVGIAIGLNVLLIPVRLPATPYGFMGKFQGLPGALDNPKDLAANLVDVLLRRPQTREPMLEGLTLALEQASSFIDSKVVADKVVATEGFTTTQLDRLAASISSNSQVGQSYGVGARIRSYVASRAAKQT
jgi:hypothetical protein